MLFFLVCCVVPSFLVSVVTTRAVRRYAPAWGLIDCPGERKVHVNPTPMGGGIAIWLGVIVPLAAVQLAAAVLLRNEALAALIPPEIAVHIDGVVYRSGLMWCILGGGTALAVTGLVDDLRNLTWGVRLGIQFGVAVAVVYCGVRATLFLPAPWLGAVVTVLWLMALVNSFNFLDNMDGLSAGIGLITSLMLAAVMLTSTGEPRWLVAGVLLVLAGSLSGFLCFNRPPASIFMGDSGSYFVGLIMASMTIVGTYYDAEGSRHVILVPLCVLAVPLYDLCSVMFIRLRAGRSPFHGDKSHFSHRLVELGLSSRNAVLTIHLATFTTGLGALLLYRVRTWSGAFLIVALIASVLAIVAILETAGRRRQDNS